MEKGREVPVLEFRPTFINLAGGLGTDHVVLIAMFPVWILLINTIKTKKDIYANPFGVPAHWTWENYRSIIADSTSSILPQQLGGGGGLADDAPLLGSRAPTRSPHWRTRISGAIYFAIISDDAAHQITTIAGGR
jgi:ABC-type maltose transport system permease subunit